VSGRGGQLNVTYELAGSTLGVNALEKVASPSNEAGRFVDGILDKVWLKESKTRYKIPALYIYQVEYEVPVIIRAGEFNEGSLGMAFVFGRHLVVPTSAAIVSAGFAAENSYFFPLVLSTKIQCGDTLWSQHEVYVIAFGIASPFQQLQRSLAEIYGTDSLAEQAFPAMKLLDDHEVQAGIDITNQFNPLSCQELLLRFAIKQPNQEAVAFIMTPNAGSWLLGAILMKEQVLVVSFAPKKHFDQVKKIVRLWLLHNVAEARLESYQILIQHGALSTALTWEVESPHKRRKTEKGMGKEKEKAKELGKEKDKEKGKEKDKEKDEKRGSKRKLESESSDEDSRSARSD